MEKNRRNGISTEAFPRAMAPNPIIIIMERTFAIDQAICRLSVKVGSDPR
ncbi:hypothetical protein ACX0G7_27050 [Flavitalea antarctica]